MSLKKSPLDYREHRDHTLGVGDFKVPREIMWRKPKPPPSVPLDSIESIKLNHQQQPILHGIEDPDQRIKDPGQAYRRFLTQLKTAVANEAKRNSHIDIEGSLIGLDKAI